MRNHLDTYLDTKEKRRCAYGVLVIFMMIILWIPYILQARALIHMQAYEDVFGLLRSSLADQTYLSRFIIALIQCDTMNIRLLVQLLLSTLRLVEVMALMLWVILGMTSSYRRTFRFQLALFAIWLIIMAITIITALQSRTLMQAVRLLHQIGYVTLAAFGIALLLQCFAFFQYLCAYRQALKYRVVEINEPYQKEQEKTYGQ